MSVFSKVGGHGPDFSTVTLGSPYKYNTGYPTKYIDGDSFYSTWADNGTIYMSHCDSYNWTSTSTADSYNLSISSIDGYSTSATGTRVNAMTDFGAFATRYGSDNANYKATSLMSVSGVLYCAVIRQDPPTGAPYLTRAANSTIIKSTDHGANWTPLPPGTGLPYASPMFPGNTFCTPTFIQYGQDYSDGVNSVHNSDLYVYATSNNRGLHANDNELVIGRCLISNLPNLLGSDWSYWTGGDGMNDANWTSAAASAVPIRNSILRCSGGPVYYLPYWKKYIMLSNYNIGVPSQLISTSVGWEILKSDFPWGPYSVVKSVIQSSGGQYFPFLVPSSLAADGGKTFTMFVSGDWQSQNFQTGEYTLQIMTATLS